MMVGFVSGFGLEWLWVDANAVVSGLLDMGLFLVGVWLTLWFRIDYWLVLWFCEFRDDCGVRLLRLWLGCSVLWFVCFWICVSGVVRCFWLLRCGLMFVVVVGLIGV